MIAAEMRRARSRAREMSRRVAREAARELSGGEKTVLYVAGGVGALALGWWALTRKSPMQPPASSSSSTTTTTAPGTPAPAPAPGTPAPAPAPGAPAPSPTTPGAPAPAPSSNVNPAAQTYVTAAFAGTALPWNPPSGTVSISGTAGPSVTVTDPTLIAMAQHALWYIGTQSGTASVGTLSATYPITDPGGITGNINPAFTSALSVLQSAAGTQFNSGNTPLNTSGTLDYKTLAALIFLALVLYVKQTGTSAPTTITGVDQQMVNMATAGLSKLVLLLQPGLSSATTASQLRNIETAVDASMGTNGSLFSQSGVFDWQAWALCVGVGA